MTPFKTFALALPLAVAALPVLADGHAATVPEEIGVAVDAADSVGIIATLLEAGPVTVFVPTNDAVAAAPQDALNDLLADTDRLTSVISGYAIPGTVLAADVLALESGTTVETLGGGALTVTLDGDTVMVGPDADSMATVTATDLQFGNITIHVIDGAFLPASE